MAMCGSRRGKEGCVARSHAKAEGALVRDLLEKMRVVGAVGVSEWIEVRLLLSSSSLTLVVRDAGRCGEAGKAETRTSWPDLAKPAGSEMRGIPVRLDRGTRVSGQGRRGQRTSQSLVVSLSHLRSANPSLPSSPTTTLSPPPMSSSIYNVRCLFTSST